MITFKLCIFGKKNLSCEIVFFSASYQESYIRFVPLLLMLTLVVCVRGYLQGVSIIELPFFREELL